jgi:hypothetical protein
MDNLTAAQSGDVRTALEVLRDTLAERIDTTDKDVHAQLAAQYRATLEAIAALEVPEAKRGTVDELRERRDGKGRRTTSDASSNA